MMDMHTNMTTTHKVRPNAMVSKTGVASGCRMPNDAHSYASCSGLKVYHMPDPILAKIHGVLVVYLGDVLKALAGIAWHTSAPMLW